MPDDNYDGPNRELTQLHAENATLRQALSRMACFAATARSENTRDWMDSLIGHLNQSAVTLNEPTQFVIHRSNADGEMWVSTRTIP